ncbi:hypothetical protein AOXY_G10954 [Acipenser oxyrinchus oxyrinchus]|uniref:DUF4806 domain-containing protein n=1 Tax=Acipenser oxyrinchus oxyrinchus TaxID=40147 RepID=A0AAD8DG60_ACIOX|nr:hypothetical protein AOXY_G10954 [Acipenser oxyrinchus oxyrinchus]
MRLEGTPPQALDAPQHMTPSTSASTTSFRVPAALFATPGVPLALKHLCIPVERHILAMLHSIKLQVQHNTAVLQSLNPSQVVPSTLLKKPDGVDFLPLEDMTSLDALEERLIQEVELKKAIIAYLAPTGGSTMKETVWHICDKVFSQELSKQLNWCGRGVKQGFKPMKLGKLIVHEYSSFVLFCYICLYSFLHMSKLGVLIVNKVSNIIYIFA